MNVSSRGLGPRNDHIDFLRGLSIFVVIILHFAILEDPAPLKLTILSASSFARLYANGYFGVSMFFVISGYLITSISLKRYGSLANIDLREFYVFRMSRILPGILLLVGTVLILMRLGVTGFSGNGSLGSALWSIFTFRANLYYTQVGTYTVSWNILWSLAIEEVFYISYPLLCKAVRSPRLIYAGLLGVVAYGPVHRYLSGGGLYDYFGCFDQLAVGCLAALLVSRLQISPSVAQVLRFAGMICIIVTYFTLKVNLHYVSGPALIAVGTAASLLGSHAAPRPEGINIFSDFVKRMGKYSYEIYLFHIVFFLLLVRWGLFLRVQGFVAGGGDVVFILQALVVTIASFAVGKFALDPARKYLRVALSARKARQPAVKPGRSAAVPAASRLTSPALVRAACVFSLGLLGVLLSGPFRASAANPTLRQPKPGTVLAGRVVNFSWDPVPDAEDYWISVGTESDRGNLFAEFTNGATTVPVYLTPYPADRRIHVQILAKFRGHSIEPANSGNYEFIALANPESRARAGVPGELQLFEPKPGSVLKTSLVTFSWTPVPDAENYWIDVGTQPAHGDIYGAFTGGSTSVQMKLSGFLTGQKIYVQLYSKVRGQPIETGQGKKFEFATQPPPSEPKVPENPRLIEPKEGSVLTGSPVTFRWKPVPGALDYWIDVGTTPAQGDIFGGATKGATSVNVNLSAHLTGQKIYVQLYSEFPDQPAKPGNGSKFAFGTVAAVQ